MFNTFSEEDSDIIEKMNKAVGTTHRSKPYDLTDPGDVKQALTLAVAAYRDYEHYESILGKLIEDFDESLEDYDTASWFNLGRAEGKVDKLVEQCVTLLNRTFSKFGQIKEQAEENLHLVLNAALALPPPGQHDVFGKAYKLGRGDPDELIFELLISFCEVEYSYKIEDSFADFLKHMEEEWADYLV